MKPFVDHGAVVRYVQRYNTLRDSALTKGQVVKQAGCRGSASVYVSEVRLRSTGHMGVSFVVLIRDHVIVYQCTSEQ